MEDERTFEEIANTQHFLHNDSGRYIARLDVGNFIAPVYAKCNSCPFAPANGGDCDVYEPDADCIIERSFFDVLIATIADQGIDDLDRLVVYQTAQQLIRLRRLYALENELDLRQIFVQNEHTGKNYTADLWEKILKLIDSNEKGFMQKLKELLATRKEREKGTKKKTNTQSFLDVLKTLEAE